MILQDILRVKGTDVYSISPDASLADVVQLLVAHNCGSLVVTASEDSTKIAGIITERDILRACASGKPLSETTVRSVMTENVITGSLDDPVSDIMGTMTDHRIRHLPVIQDGRLVGIISIGDVVKAQHDHVTAENHYLKNYIQG